MTKDDEPVGIDNIKNICLIMSGKGGVGKSTIICQLALKYQSCYYKVGVLDIDLCGPSIPRILGCESNEIIESDEGELIPTEIIHKFNDDNKFHNIKVISLAFGVNSKDDAVIWRGPKKTAMISQLLNNARWGDLDILLIDTPPGTSDEHISIMSNLATRKNLKGAILISTPQMASISQIIRQITFCHKVNCPIIGLIENMNSYKCPNCDNCTHLFAHGGVLALSKDKNIPFLGGLPLNTKLMEECESESKSSNSFILNEIDDIYENIKITIH
ncbi:hypothetical protein A3Q56_01800 [Intoshia linei]|uniref:Cytosolic Fe-S cluster assembly factor NUBP2 homolog n=1 Tax=Intoshia linei TaxID=1819745 RepID=A0A177BA98_9BILA|nr:hypothetical protein A3Q56_01800 [Intoshia linei]